MQVGKAPPEWAPKMDDIVIIKRCDGGGGYHVMEEPFEFVVFMADSHGRQGSQQVRLMGRTLASMNDPEPGVAALFIESTDDFTQTGRTYKLPNEAT